MAGNEISWIRARPKELRLVEASGRNNPMIRETGRSKKTNDLTDRSPRRKSLKALYSNVNDLRNVESFCRKDAMEDRDKRG